MIKMVVKAMATFVVMLACISFVHGARSGYSELSEKEMQEHTQDLALVKKMKNSFTSGLTNDLSEYKKFVDEIQHTWSQRNKEYYARLMLAACEPLSSGSFKDNYRHELAREYALSALENPDAIPLTLELELTGHVITLMVSNAPKDEVFSECRRKDVKVRLHAWKRLTDAIDPKWDPADMPHLNIEPPTATGLPGGVAPAGIKDETLRVEYEMAIQRNKQKAEEYSEQNKLHRWLGVFPNRAENYIIQAYSHTPFNIEELKKSLNDYSVDEKTKVRILDAVIKNTQETQKE